jgi:hypothetical protein
MVARNHSEHNNVGIKEQRLPKKDFVHLDLYKSEIILCSKDRKKKFRKVLLDLSERLVVTRTTS